MNNFGFFAGSIPFPPLTGFVPYVGATQNVNLGAFSISATTAQVGAGTNSGQALEVFQSTSSVKIGSLVGTPSDAAIYLNQATPSATNYTFWQSGATLTINSSSNTLLRVNNLTKITLSATSTSFNQEAATGGAITTYSWTKPNNTTQLASTNIQGFLFTTGSRQWNTGSITTQQEFLITSPTYLFASVSTITDAYTLYVNAPTAGTNATITNNYAAGFAGNISLEGGNRTINASNALTIRSGFGTGLALYGGQGGNITLGNNNVANLVMWSSQTSGALTPITFSPNVSTNQTLSTNIPNFRVNGANKQWATGALATQYFNYFPANTVSFVGASTATNVYGLFVEAATAGTNATITNNYAAGFSGGIEVTTGNSLFRGVITISRGVDANVANFGISSGSANIGVFAINTDQPNSRVLLTSRNSNTLNLGTQDTIRMSIDTSGNIICGVGAIATNATNGFLYVPSCAGIPTGTPTTVTGRVPIVADSTNNKLYIYSGGAWVALN